MESSTVARYWPAAMSVPTMWSPPVMPTGASSTWVPPGRRRRRRRPPQRCSAPPPRSSRRRRPVGDAEDDDDRRDGADRREELVAADPAAVCLHERLGLTGLALQVGLADGGRRVDEDVGLGSRAWVMVLLGGRHSRRRVGAAGQPRAGLGFRLCPGGARWERSAEAIPHGNRPVRRSPGTRCAVRRITQRYGGREGIATDQGPDECGRDGAFDRPTNKHARQRHRLVYRAWTRAEGGRMAVRRWSRDSVYVPGSILSDVPTDRRSEWHRPFDDESSMA